MCQSNLRQLGQGFQGDLEDHKRLYPGPAITPASTIRWHTMSAFYMGMIPTMSQASFGSLSSGVKFGVFRCPSDGTNNNRVWYSNYGFNGNYSADVAGAVGLDKLKEDEIRRPSSMFFWVTA
jgi:hypothetical protein